MNDSRATRLLLYALFFFSGVAGLVYQIVWTRMLVLVFGNTILATSTVLSAFMGGLAAGSFALGLYVDRRPRALVRLYAVLEAGVGVFALLFPWLLDLATPLYAGLYRTFEGNLLAVNLARFGVCFVLIGIPTFLMGGTLPVLLKRFARRPAGAARPERGTLGTHTGFLYGLNTAGAVAGTLACGYFLLKALGMEHTVWVAVGLNLGVAAVAWVLGWTEGSERAAAGESSAQPPAHDLGARPAPPVRPAGAATVTAVLVGIGLSGFCALAYEVFWARMLNLFLHNNIYSFTAILATFLTGIAVGSLVYSRFLSRIRDQVPLFVGLQLGIGLLAYATPFVFSLLHGPLFNDFSEALTLAKTSVIMLPPTVLMGIAVPMAVQICQRGAHREGTSVGTVYAVNTVGSILGAFAAGFVLLPGLGLHPGVILVAGLNVLAGVLPALTHSRRWLRPAWGAGFAAVIAAFVLLAPPDLFRRLFERSHRSAEILHYKEGKIANVVVYDFQKDGYKDLHLNAVEEASSRLWHVQLFKLLGILPPMLHEDPGDALMVAFGAGMSAGATVDHVDELSVVDLNPDIEGVAEVFRRENLGVIDHPKFTKVVNDGRNALLLSPDKYSLIISDATNPKMFDSWTLYSREFYELVKSRLEPDGIFAQWVLIPLPADSIQVTLATFRSVFPHASFWCIYGSSQCLMLATPERLEIDYGALERRLEPVLGSSGLREFGVPSVEKFLSFFFLGEDHLGEYLEGFDKINTDDLPHAQFHVEQDRAGIEASIDLVRHRESILPYLTNRRAAPDDLERTLATYDEIARRLHLGFLNGNPTRYREAAQVAADAGLPDANVRSMLHHGPEKRRYFEARVADHPDDPNAHNTLGFIAWREGDLERAELELRRAVELAPDFPQARANLARVLRDRGALDAAAEELLALRELHPTKRMLQTLNRELEIVRLHRKLRHRPEDAALHRALGVAYYNAGRLGRAIDAYRAAAEAAPDDPEILFNLARIFERHELVDQAADAYDRLAQMVPGDSRVGTRRAELAALSEPARRRSWQNARMTARWAGWGSGEGARPEGESGPDATEDEHPETCDRALAAWHDADFGQPIDRGALARAAALYEESVAARADDLHAYADAATLYELLGRTDRAIDLWRGASRVEPDWRLPELQIERLELRERLDSGPVEGMERAELLQQIARTLRSLGDPERSRRSLEEALEAAPERAGLWADLAATLMDLGEYPGALDAAERALALAPGLERAEGVRTAVEEALRPAGG